MKPVNITISHTATDNQSSISRSYMFSEDDVWRLADPGWRESAKRKIRHNLQDQLEQVIDDAIATAVFLKKKEKENA